MPIFELYKDKDSSNVYRLKEKDVCKYISYSNFILKQCRKRHYIPERVMMEFMSLMSPTDEEITTYYEGLAKQKTEFVYARYKDDKLYQFDKKLTAPEPTVINRKIDSVEDFFNIEIPIILDRVTLWDMIHNTINVIIEYEIDKVDKGYKEPTTKEEIIRLAFMNINAYIFTHFTKREANNYKSQRREILAGYIAMAFDFELVDRRKPLTNERIHQATRNALRVIKPTKKRKASSK